MLSEAPVRTKDIHRIQNMIGWKCVSISDENMFAIRSDGTLWCTGSATYFPFINNPFSIDFQQVGMATDWAYVSCHKYSCLAIKTDGTLWAAGYNLYKQLGLGTDAATQLSVFIQIGTATDWTKCYCEERYSYAEKTNGMLYSAGNGTYGTLGHGNTADVNTFTQVANSGSHTKVCINKYCAAVLKTDGTIWNCGYNAYFQFGYLIAQNTVITTMRMIPTEYNTNGDFIDFAVLLKSIVAIKDNSTYAKVPTYLGLPDTGSWGSDATTGHWPDFRPTDDGSIQPTGVQGVYGYYASLFVKKDDNTLWATGLNNCGQLGLGHQNYPYAYTQVTIPSSSVAGMDCAAYNSIRVDTDGTLHGTGYNQDGVLGLGLGSLLNLSMRTLFTNISQRLIKVKDIKYISS